MKPWSSDRSLGLPDSGDIEVSASPGDGGIYWAKELPPASFLPELLSCRQIWASRSLLASLERLGVPACRLREVECAEQGEEAAAKLSEGSVDLVWRGPFGRNSSLSAVNSMMVEGLETQGLRVELQAVGAAPSSLSVPAVSQSWPPDLLPASAGPQVTFSPWEYFYVPKDWVSKGPLSSNRWWTPSDYAKEGMVESGLFEDWVEVIPNGVDLSTFRPDGEKLFEDELTVFLFVGGTIFRKGLDILMRAWDLAFSAEEPALLLIKDFGSDSHYAGQNILEELEAWSSKEGHAPVRVIRDFIPPEQMPDLYRSGDVGVFPYRGEGFCMPALEAMACGLPIIYPEMGPSGEYCKEGGWAVPASRSRLAAPADLPLISDPLVYEIDPEDLAQALRGAMDGEAREAKGLAARHEAQGFSWQAAADKAKISLERISQEEPVFSVSPSRPDGERLVLCASPAWGSSAYHKPLLEAAKAISGRAVTLALFQGDLAQEAAIEELSLVLGGEGEQADLSLVEAESFASLALGCDGVVLLSDDSMPWIGRPQLSPGSLPRWLQAKSSTSS